MNTRAVVLGTVGSIFAALLAARAGAEPDRDGQRACIHASAEDPTPYDCKSIAGSAQSNWQLEGAAYLYFLPESSNYLQPTLRADHHWLHLEARYAYEDRRTGSAWVGLNAAGGDAVSWEVRPMFGSVFGRTNGIAAGYEGALAWWKLELYSEGEFLVDFSSVTDSFFFNWSEFTLAPVDWCRFGLMAQRSRVYSSGRELERGVMAGFSWKHAQFSLHVLNPDDTNSVVIIAVGAQGG